MPSHAWTISCNLGPVVGYVSVDPEENSAAIATAAVYIGTGQDIDSYIGGAFTLAGLFTGVVNHAQYDETTGVATFRASDLLQEYCEGLTETEILALIPGGKYSRDVFGDREDGWQQMQDVLSTVTKEVHKNVAGTVVVNDWTTTDPGPTASTSIYGTPTRRPARRRDIINRVIVTVQVRYTRLHHRNHTFGWDYGHTTFCDFYVNSHSVPLRDMVQSAADGAGWRLQGGIAFETFPDTGVYTCFGNPVAWAIDEAVQNQVCIAANWTCVKRWTQTITETYTLIVENTLSQTAYGILTQEDGATYTEEYDDAQYDQSIETSIPTGAGWSTDAIGDYVYDEIDRTESGNVIETTLAKSASRIAQTNRRSFLDYEIDYDSSLEIGDVVGAGKIYQLTHRLDPNSGRATSLVRVAYSPVTGGASDALTAPLPPDTGPTHTAPASITTLLTRIGCGPGTEPFDEEWTGYTGNNSLCTAGEEVYPNRFRVVTPDIEDEARDEVTAERIETYNAPI
jgi:hypothetical protein